MMAAWARLLLNKAVAGVVVALVLLLTVVCGVSALAVEQDDDLLAFLPQDNATVVQFHAMNKTFGGLNVALVGVEVDDPFDAAFLTKLGQLTRKLNDEQAIAYALSLANIEDFVADPVKGGIRAGYLVEPLPTNKQERDELYVRAMSKDHVVGNVVSRDGKAVVIYAFGASDADPRALAELVRHHVNEALPDHTKYWGGAPFISTYIYDITQQDMRALLPWSVLIIVVIVVASFRDVIGALLSLLSTGAGIAVAYALMSVNGVKANIVLSSMPVILFAVGSAYAIHVLARYYVLAQKLPADEALVATLRQVGPTVLAAGLTTVAGLLSFLAMDIQPLRQFGLYTGLGILATLVLSLTFVPAVVSLIKLKGRDLGESMLARGLAGLCGYARRQRVVVLVALAALGIGGAFLVGRVEARMENAAFFSAGSPPDQAQSFLRDQFGGSLFIQVQISGDMNDPDVLRELQHFADTVAREEHVSSTIHIGQVLSLLNEAMSGERRVPVEPEQVRLLYRFLAGRPALDQLVDRDRKQALIQIKVDSDTHEVVTPLLARIEKLSSDGAISGYRLIGRAPRADGASDANEPDGKQPPASGDDDDDRDDDSDSDDEPSVTPAAAISAEDAKLRAERLASLASARLLAHLRSSGISVSDANVSALQSGVSKLSDSSIDPAAIDSARSKVSARLASYLKSGESMLDTSNRGRSPALADAMAALGPDADHEAMVAATASALEREPGDELVQDVALASLTPLQEAWRQERQRARAAALLAQSGLTVPAGAPGERLVAGAGYALMELGNHSALVSSAAAENGRLTWAVNGVPVLYRGLSTSVTNNQVKSLGLALGLVLVIMMVLFRSPLSGLLAAAPTALTLILVYGAMGAQGLHLDIGTSMLASIIIGAGVDYAVHLMAAWRAGSEDLEQVARDAAAHAGPAIATNALMVAAGFFVLTLGEARPLQNVGGLTAAAMLVAGVVTFLLISALGGNKRYAPWQEP